MTIYDLLFLFAMLATAVTVAALLVLLVRRRFRTAVKVLIGYAICAVAYLGIGVAVSAARRQSVLAVGDSWCFDDWCLTVQNVSRTAEPQDVAYRTDLRVFSKAGRVSQRAKGAWIYLIDDAGRLYPPEADPSAAPLDMLLQPMQSVTTSRTFHVPSSAAPIGLITGHGGSYCGAMSLLIIGHSGCLFKKPTMVRIQ